MSSERSAELQGGREGGREEWREGGREGGREGEENSGAEFHTTKVVKKMPAMNYRARCRE